MDENRIDIEQLLENGKVIQLPTRGYSMYPMLVSGRDAAIIAPVDGKELKRGDVVLYRRDNSILVLHRVWKVRKEGLYMVGDNQTEVEGPLRLDQVRGILVGFVRKGREIPVSNVPYRICSRLWLLLRPIRHKLAVVVHHFRRKTQ